MKKNGILAAGNWIIDRVKVIDSYPQEEQLANVLMEYISNGGSAYNVLKDLNKLDPDIPLEAIGLVGMDEDGRHILEDCRKMNINCTQLRKMSGIGTSYTDVMSVKATGKRTFFHHRGANAHLGPEHFDFSRTKAKFFHLGYLLLLDKLDEWASSYKTNAAMVLSNAKSAGLTTSVDLVSENSARFAQLIPSSLPFVDYLFVNEYEAGKLIGNHLFESTNKVNQQFCEDACRKILEMGVREWVIMHFPSGAFAMHKNGSKLVQPSVCIPEKNIAGAVGAGDAFAAGVLWALSNNKNMKEALNTGVSVAATCLLSPTSSDGIQPIEECLSLANKYGFRNLPF